MLFALAFAALLIAVFFVFIAFDSAHPVVCQVIIAILVLSFLACIVLGIIDTATTTTTEYSVVAVVTQHDIGISRYNHKTCLISCVCNEKGIQLEVEPEQYAKIANGDNISLSVRESTSGVLREHTIVYELCAAN